MAYFHRRFHKKSAIDASLKDPATRTADLGGKLGTKAFAKHVISLIGQEFAGTRAGKFLNYLYYQEVICPL